MNLGVFMMPLHPPEKSRTQCFEEDVEMVERAEALGCSEVWVGQHHTLAWEPIPANDLFLATVIPRTRRIRLGPGVSILPQHHPANVAVRLAMLDHLSHGRLNCGFGQGGVPTDHELFGLPDPLTQGLMTLEAMDMILKLWQIEAPFDLQGRFWRLRIQGVNPKLGMGTMLKPFQKPHPPIAMSVIKAQSMAARLAGERGYLPLSTNLVPSSTVVEHWKTYSASAEKAGRAPDRGKWRVARSILIGENSRAAWEHARRGTLARSFEYIIALLEASKMLHLLKHDTSIPDSEVTTEYLLKTLCIIGGPKEVREQLESLWVETGGFGTLLMIAHDWDEKERWFRSMELLANEVLPVLPSLERSPVGAGA
ncbi:MAG: LLM class flavin-dependent oxidoreductase [Acidobacteria bacterium]|nr:LLM class flavin-dependent oxidoreductase [Acidobacteriota bacterium]